MTAKNQDFVVKNGLQVTSNLVVGTYTGNPSVAQSANGAIISGNVGIGTSAIDYGTKLVVANGNIQTSTLGFGYVFPDGTFQTTAAANTPSYGAQGTVQFAGAGNTFSGNTAALFWNDATQQLTVNGNVITNNLLGVSGLNLGAQGGGSFVTITNNGYVSAFNPGGTFQPAGAIIGSTYGSNQIDVTQYTMQLKGLLYGIQITTSPDQGITNYVWNYNTNGQLDAPVGIGAVGNISTAQSVYANSIVSNTTISASALTVSGNVTAGNLVGNTATVSGNSTFGGNVVITSNTAATSQGTGALQVQGGASISGNLFLAGNFTVSGNLNIANVGGIQDLVVNSLTANTFIQSAGIISGSSINSNTSITAINYVNADQFIANTNVGIGTATVQYPLDMYGNIHIGNTATISGILFPDGTFQDTAAVTTVSTPSYGTQGTIQFAGAGNTFSGNTASLFWDDTNYSLYANAITTSAFNSTGNVQVDRLISNLSVGIGTTTAVGIANAFAVYGSENLYGNLVLQTTAGSTTSGIYFADGSYLITAGGGGSYSNANVTSYLSGPVQIGNLTVTNTTVSTNTTTGALLVGGGVGVGGNLNVGGAQSLFTNSVGIGTSTAPISSNILSVYGNVVISNTVSGGSGVYFPDGSFQTTAVTPTNSYGTVGTIQFAGSANTFSGNSSALFWDSSNNWLGIGTNLPTQPLTLLGNLLAYGNTHVMFGRLGIGTSNIKVGDNLTVVGGNINVASYGTGIFFPDGSFQQSSAGSSAAGSDKSVQFNDGGLFAGQNNFIFDKTNLRLGIGTSNLTNSLMVYSATPALFNTTNAGDQQIIVGNTTTDGTVIGFNSGTTTAYGYMKSAGGATNIVVTKTGTGIGGITVPQNTLDVGGRTAIGFAYAGVYAAPTDSLIVSGKVGIGTYLPYSALDVMTNASIRSNISVADTAYLNLLVANTSIQSIGTLISDSIYSNSFVQAAGTVTAANFVSNGDVKTSTLNASSAATVGSLNSNAHVQAVGAITAAYINSNGNVQAAGTVTVNDLISNNNVYSATLNTSGLAQLDSLISNNNITTATLNATGAAQVNSFIANTTIQSIGTATVDAIVSNNNVYGATLNTSGLAQLDSLISNNNITTATLNTTGAAVAGSLTSNTTIQSAGTATVNALISNNNVFGATLQSSGQALVNSLISNNNITTSTLNSTGDAQVGSLTSNTTIQSAGTAIVNALISNTNVFGATLQSSGQALVNSLVSNNNITTATLNSTGAAQVNSFIANTTIQSIGTATVNALIGNNNVFGATLQSSGQATVNSLVGNNNVFGATLQSSGQALVNSLVSNTTISTLSMTLLGTLTAGNVYSNGFTQTAGLTTTNQLISNANIYGANLNIAGLAQLNSLISNTTIQSIGTATVNALISNNNIFGATLNTSGLAQLNSLISNTTAQVGGTATVNALNSNNNIFGATLNTSGLAQFNSIISNNNITGATLNITGAAQVGSLISNTNTTTATLNSTGAAVVNSLNSNTTIQSVGNATVGNLISNGTITTSGAGGNILGVNTIFAVSLQGSGLTTINQLISNANIYGANLNIAGLGYINSLNVNTATSTASLNVGAGGAIVGNLISNGYTTTATLNVTGNAQVNDITVNTVVRTSTITSTGAAIFANINSNGIIQSAGTTTVNALISNTNIFGATLNTSGAVVVGSLTSNTTIQSNGAAVFNSFTANTRSFVTSGGMSITGDSLVTGNLTITGNLTFGGNSFVINTQSLTIVDPVIELGIGTGGTALTVDDGLDRGVLMDYYHDPAYNGETAGFNHAFMGYNNSTGQLIYVTNVAPGNINVNNDIEGIPGIIYGGAVFGNIWLSNVQSISTNTTSGGVVAVGGIGAGGNINVGGQRNNFSGNINIFGSNAATSSTTGALTVTGGVGVIGNLFVGGNLNSNNGAQFSYVIASNAITAASLFSNGAVQSVGTVTAAAINSNGTIVGANVYSNGFVQSAGTVTAALVNSNGTIVGANVYSNGFVQAAGTVTAALINSNGAIVGQSLTSNTTIQAAGTAIINAIYSNTFIQAAGTITSNGVISNVYGVFGQNVTVNSANTSTSTSTGALIVTSGGVGIGGNINVGGTRNLFTNNVGIGTSTATGLGNVLAVYGTENLYGNLVISNTAAGGSGIYFPDGTFQQTAGTIGGVNQSVQFNDNGAFGGTATFLFDKVNNRLGIGTANLTNSLMIYSATPALFNTTNAGDQQIIVGNTTSDGTVIGFNSGTATAYGYMKSAGGVTNIVVTKTGTGIGGITVPQNTLDVSGRTAIGFAYAGVVAAPTDSLIVSGKVGIGTSTPLSTLDVRGVGSFLTALSTGGTATVNDLISNNNVFGATLQSSGQALVDSLVSNGAISGASITLTGAAVVSSLTSNTTIQSAGTATLNAVIGNNNVFGATLQSSGQALVNSAVSNNNITTATFNSTGAAQVNSFIANTTIQGISTATVNTLISNVYGLFGQNVTVNSANTSTTTGTGALVITTGGAGIAGNINVGGTRSLFTNSVGIGTSTPTGVNSNVFAVYGTQMLYGNLDLGNTAAGGTGIYFADGTFQVTAAIPYTNVNVASYLSGPVVVGNLTISNTTASTSTTTGALLMGGGAGIQGSVNIGGNLSVALASQLSFVNASNSIVGSSMTSNGAIQAAGTVTAANIVSNGDVKTSTLNASSTATVGGLNSNAQVQAVGAVTATYINSNGTIVGNNIYSNGFVQAAGTATVNALISNVYGRFGQNVTINSTNAASATSATTGALVVAGGAGIASGLTTTGFVNFIGSGALEYTVRIKGSSTGDQFAIATNGTPGYGVANDALNAAGTAYSPYAVSASTVTIKTGSTVPAAALTLTEFGNSTFAQNLTISSSNTSTSTGTGALIVLGGVGVAGNVISGGNLVHAGASSLSFVIASNSIVGSSITSNSSIQSAGTAIVNALTSNVYGLFGQNVTVNSANASTSTGTGALVITTGGLGVGGAIHAGGQIYTATTLNVAGTAQVNTLISNVYGLFGQNVTVNSTNASTATTNGALTVAGGIGVAGNVISGGNLIVPLASNLSFVVASNSIVGSSMTSNGYVQAATQVLANAIISNVYGLFGQNVTVNSTNASTATTNGALVVAGGAGIGGNINAGGSRNTFTNYVGVGTSSALGMSSNVLTVYGSEMVYGNIVLQTPAGSTTSGIYFADGSYLITAGGGGSYSNANVTNYLSGPVQVGNLTINNATASTSTVTGALLMFGGAGIQGNVNVGGNLSVALASQLSFVIASNSIVGSSITSNSTIQSAGTATVNALVSNVYGVFGQNVTVNSTNASTSSSTGALVVAGGQGLGGNLRVAAATTSLFGGNLGIGTTSSLGATSNVLSVYGTEMLYGNLRISNTAAGGSGIYFSDGTFMTTAATGGGSGTPGGSDTNIQYNNGGTLGGSTGFVFFGNTTSVGIGTSAPAYKLDVWGNIHIGNSTAGGSNGIVFADGSVQTTAANTSIQTFTFTATLGQTTFSVFPYAPGPQGVNYTQVFVNGVYQRTSTYAWTGTNIVLSSGAVQFARVEIRITVAAGTLTNVGSQIAGSNVFNVQTAGVTVWNTGFNYTVGYLDLYLNGVKLALGSDYTAGTGTSVTFAASPPVGSIVQMTGWNSNGTQQVQGSNVFNVQTAGVTVWNTGFTYTVGFLDVYVNGIKMASGYDYTATTGTSVQFTTAPNVNSLVTFEGWLQGSTLGQMATQRKAFYVSSAGQTVFASQGPYVPPYVDVYVNGVKLVYTTDYTATDGATVVLTNGLTAGANVEVISSMTFAIGDVVRRTGDIFTGNVGIGTTANSNAFVVVGTSQFYGPSYFYGNISTTSNITLGGTLIFADGTKQNTASSFQIQPIDNISSAFDSKTTQFNLKVNGSNINIASPLQVMLSVGGTVLAPFITNPDLLDMPEVTIFDQGYKLSGSKLTFANAPRQQQSFSARILSNTTPSVTSVTYPYKPLSIAMADS